MSIKVSTFTEFNRVSIFLVIVFWFFASCNLLYDEGDWVGETRSLESFQSVDIEGIADVHYHQSSEYKVRVFYYEKHLSDIQTNINNQTMRIVNQFNGQWFTDIRKPLVEVYAPTLNKVDIKEAGSFFCEDTLTGNFVFYMHGDVFEAHLLTNSEKLKIDIYNSVGLLSAKGYCEQLEILNKGETQIDAFDLQANNADVMQQSAMDISCSVTNSLIYKITRNGNLIVRGNPSVSGESLGDGDLIIMNNE
mgnify:CR=1 FL=1